MTDAIRKMCEQHFNEPIICNSEVVRLIGYGETARDCYLICSPMRRDIFWNTAVGGYVFLDRLKGQDYVKSTEGEDWDDLFRLDTLLELNGAPKVESFIVDIRPDEDEGQQAAHEEKARCLS